MLTVSPGGGLTYGRLCRTHEGSGGRLCCSHQIGGGLPASSPGSPLPGPAPSACAVGEKGRRLESGVSSELWALSGQVGLQSPFGQMCLCVPMDSSDVGHGEHPNLFGVVLSDLLLLEMRKLRLRGERDFLKVTR